VILVVFSPYFFLIESLTVRRASVADSVRTVGIIGGLGPESTVDYYRYIIARFRVRHPGGGYPHIIVNSLDVDKGIAMLDAGRLAEKRFGLPAVPD
jgi:hypothetical protein